MKYILACLLSILAVSTPVFSYPQAQFDDCINSTKENPELVDIPDKSIEGFCDCALTEIFDKNKIDKLWINVCIKKNFND